MKFRSPQPFFFCTKRRKVGAKEIYWQQIEMLKLCWQKIIGADWSFFFRSGEQPANDEQLNSINDTPADHDRSSEELTIEPAG